MYRGYRLAVDFGTSNTAAAVQSEDGRIQELRLGARTDSIPSAVFNREGDLVVGEEAVRLAQMAPHCFESAPKRRLGEPVILLGQELDPVDAVAAALRQVIATAARVHGGSMPAQVILTYPQAWSDYLKNRLREASSKAGIPSQFLDMVTEPVAAAWHYAQGGAQVQPGQRVAVVDFGGGTFDVAVLDFVAEGHGAQFRMHHADGLDPLGGDDVDQMIYDWVIEQLRRDGQDQIIEGLQGESGLASRLTLRDQVREAKHALSLYPSAPIPVSAAGRTATCTLTVQEFEQMIASWVARAVWLTQNVVGQDPGSIQHLFMTGGSSLIPLVQREFQRLTAGRVATLGDPKLVTCTGALEVPELVPGGAPNTAQQPASGRRGRRSTDSGPVKFVPAAQSGPAPGPQPFVGAAPQQGSPKPTGTKRNGKLIAALAAGVVVLLALAGWGVASLLGGDQGEKTAQAKIPPPLPCSLPGEQCELLNRVAYEQIDPSTCSKGFSSYTDNLQIECALPNRGVPLQTDDEAKVTVMLMRDQRDIDDTIAKIRKRAPSSEEKAAPGKVLAQAPGTESWYIKPDPNPRGVAYTSKGFDNAKLYWSYQKENVLLLVEAKGGKSENLADWFSR